jgi:hypothetical protein
MGSGVQSVSWLIGTGQVLKFNTPSSIQVMNVWSYNSTPLHAFMAWIETTSPSKHKFRYQKMHFYLYNTFSQHCYTRHVSAPITTPSSGVIPRSSHKIRMFRCRFEQYKHIHTIRRMGTPMSDCGKIAQGKNIERCTSIYISQLYISQ